MQTHCKKCKQLTRETSGREFRLSSGIKLPSNLHSFYKDKAKNKKNKNINNHCNDSSVHSNNHSRTKYNQKMFEFKKPLLHLRCSSFFISSAQLRLVWMRFYNSVWNQIIQIQRHIRSDQSMQAQ